MIQRIGYNEVYQFDEKPFKLNVISIKPDTKAVIIVKVDQDLWDLSEVNQLMKYVTDAFPTNKVLVTFKGMEIEGVIQNE